MLHILVVLLSLCKQLISTAPPPGAALQGHSPNLLATGTSSFPQFRNTSRLFFIPVFILPQTCGA